MEPTDPTNEEQTTPPSNRPFLRRRPKDFLAHTWLGRFDQRFSLISSIFFKLGIWIFVILMGFLLIAEIRTDRTMIEAFQVPQNMESDGYNGVVMANLLMDEIKNIKREGTTIRETKDVASSMEINQLDLQIVGLGFSLRTVARYFKKNLGIPERTVSGEFIQDANQLSLNLRITGLYTEPYEESLDQGVEVATQKLLKKAAKDVMYYLEPYQLAVALSNWETRDECVDVIQYLIRTKPEEAKWAYNLWGNLLEISFRDREAAVEKYETAIKIDPNFRLPHSNFGGMLYRMDSLDRAEYHARRALEIERSYSYGNKLLGDIRFKQGFEEEAIALYEKAGKDLANKSTLHSNIAELYMESGQKEKAIASFEEAIKEDPFNSDALDELIELYRLTRQIHKAHNMADHYLKYFPEYAAGHFHHSVNYLVRMMPDSAQYHQDISKQYNQQEHFWWAIQSGIYALNDEIDLAVAHMDTALTRGFQIRYFGENPILLQISKEPKFKTLFAKHGVNFN
ncbi:MAG: tetratricopeptide repeat protein [Bacteroidota bacterium]